MGVEAAKFATSTGTMRGLELSYPDKTQAWMRGKA